MADSSCVVPKGNGPRNAPCAAYKSRCGCQGRLSPKQYRIPGGRRSSLRSDSRALGAPSWLRIWNRVGRHSWGGEQRGGDADALVDRDSQDGCCSSGGKCRYGMQFLLVKLD